VAPPPLLERPALSMRTRATRSLGAGNPRLPNRCQTQPAAHIGGQDEPPRSVEAQLVRAAVGREGNLTQTRCAANATSPNFCGSLLNPLPPAIPTTTDTPAGRSPQTASLHRSEGLTSSAIRQSSLHLARRFPCVAGEIAGPHAGKIDETVLIDVLRQGSRAPLRGGEVRSGRMFRVPPDVGVVKGCELTRRYYNDVVSPLLHSRWPGLPHAAARIGAGSEVLGLDDEISRYHDWGLLLVAQDLCSPVCPPGGAAP